MPAALVAGDEASVWAELAQQMVSVHLSFTW